MNLTNLNLDDVIKAIKNKQIKNKELFESNYKRARELVGTGASDNEIRKLTEEDVTGYYPIYLKASKMEKSENLEGALDLYWGNIYVNGTDAPGNYERMIVILNKLKRYKDLMFILQLYLACGGMREDINEKIIKRISSVEKKISKQCNENAHS